MARPLHIARPVRLGMLALLGVVGLSGCAIESVFTGSGCTDHKTSTWSLSEPTDPSTTLKIEDCRVDVDACDALCTMELDEFGTDVDEMTGCQARFEGSAVHLQVDYDVQSDAPGCEVPEPFESGTSGGSN